MLYVGINLVDTNVRFHKPLQLYIVFNMVNIIKSLYVPTLYLYIHYTYRNLDEYLHNI